MSVYFNIPKNLYYNLQEACDELSDECKISFSENYWTIESGSNKIFGWFYFSEVGSFYEIEVSASVNQYEKELNRFTQKLIELMHESVGSDACKTGRCAQ